jgi:hypothetical protein
MIEDLAAELVAEYDLLLRAHETVVAAAHHEVVPVVAVVACVKVRAAYSAAEDAEQDLALLRDRIRPLDDLQFGVLADDGLHLVLPLPGPAVATSSAGAFPRYCLTVTSDLRLTT